LAVGDNVLAGKCSQAAEQLKSSFLPTFLNPDTGLIAAWKSLDGKLHDNASTYINAQAICYGLVNDSQAKEMLSNLENLRKRLGYDDFTFGIPVNLKPIPRSDYLPNSYGSPLRDDGLDTFGMYCKGRLVTVFAGFYLKALSLHGFIATADQICDQLLESYGKGIFEGVSGSGTEFFTPDGSPCGYEGTLVHGYHTLMAIAQHKKYINTLEPEWWPN
jgi:hypothetical protein